MQIKVSGKHVEITDPIRAYAQDKTAKLPRYYDRVTQLEVILGKMTDKPGADFEIEIIADVEGHDSFVAKSTGTDLYGCIDSATDKMERQLTDHKEKLRNRKHPKS